LLIEPTGANHGAAPACEEKPHEGGPSALARLFIENLPAAVALGVAQATLLASALWTLVSTPWLLTWYALVLVQGGIRVAMYLGYRRDTQRDPEKWIRRLFMLAAANGVICGAFGLLFATQVTVPYQLLILVVLTCLAAESALAAAMILPNIFVVFVVTALLPLIAYCFLGTSVQQAAALSILLAIALQMRIGHRHHQLLESSARLDAEQQELRDELEKKKHAEIHFLRTRTMLLGAMGHDLLHPVHGMRLMVEALRDKGTAPPAITDALQSGLDTLTRQLNAILNTVRLDPGTYQPEILAVPVQALLERVVADNTLNARTRGLSLHCGKTTLWVKADPLLLHSILDNLVDNAIRHAQRGRVLVGARREAGATKLEIWDSGVGIAPAEFANIWREGYRVAGAAKSTGSGMGLALVKEMAELMDAGVSVRSTPGKGSRFAIRLPAATPPGTGGV
jgi:signal transduction histidine kinase